MASNSPKNEPEDVGPGISATRRKRIQEIKDNKEFYFRVDKVACTFESAVEDVFLEFEFGGIIKDAKTEQAVEMKRKVKKTNAEGVEEEVEVTDMIYKREIQIHKPRAGSFFSRLKGNVKAKIPTNFHGFSFDGTWKGQYKNLNDELVSIKVWRKVWYGANILMGVGTDHLMSIAASKMDRDVRIFKYIPGGQTARRETICHLRYKCEFQEKYTYNIDFRDWQLVRRELPNAEDEEKIEEILEPSSSKPREIQFQLENTRKTFFEKCFTCCFKDNTAVLPMEKYYSSKQRGIVYQGTRSWLEDENLTISLYKTIGCLRVLLGSVSVDLQGTLDYGYITQYMVLRENVNCMNSYCSCCPGITQSHESKFKVKGVIDSNRPAIMKKVTLPMPLYRQLGNTDPKVSSGLFGRGSQPNTFLVFKIIRCKGLTIPHGVLEEFKDNLCPSVTVEWSSIRKSTRIVKGSDCYWDDECHFKIPDRLTSTGKPPEKLDDFSAVHALSQCTLSVWDNDKFAKSPLGYCTVDFKSIYEKRKKKKIRAFSSNGRMVDRLVYEIKHQQLVTPFSLGVPGVTNIKPVPKPDNSNKKNSNSKDDDDSAGTPYIEYLVYFDRLDSHAVPLIKRPPKNRNKPKAGELPDSHSEYLIPDLTVEYLSRGRAFWDDALRHINDRSRRFFTFFGKDEYSGKLYFLPAFVKPMQPPNELRMLGKLLYFIYSIECSRKLEVLEDPVTGQMQTRNDTWQWCDPYFFLEKRRGDIKDHALLLCNFLIGLNHHAYVCIGSARTRSKKKEPHVWVMTLEEEKQTDEEKEAAKLAEEQGEDPPIRRKIVRFWEVTNGQTYELYDRFHTMPPAHDAKRFEEEEEEEVPEANEEVEKERLAQEINFFSQKEGEDEGQENVEQKSQEEEKQNPDPLHQSNLNTLNNDNVPTIDDEDDSDAENETDLLSMSIRVPAQANPKAAGASSGAPVASVIGPNSGPGVRVVDTAAPPAHSIFDQQQMARVEIARQSLRYRRNQLQDLAVVQYKREKKTRVRQTPYTSLDVVFNHEHLYANLQTCDPELMKYDFLSHSKRWFEFKKKHYQEYLNIPKLSHFYVDKALVSTKAPQRDAEELEFAMSERIKDTIRVYREYNCRMDTDFISKFEFQKLIESNDPRHTAFAYISKRLKWEFEESEKAPKLEHLNEIIDGDNSNVVKDEDQPSGPHYADRQWRPLILNDLPEGYVYKEEILTFKHSDANRIADTIVSKCRHLIQVDESKDPKFAIGAKIQRLACSICPTKMLLCVIQKQ